MLLVSRGWEYRYKRYLPYGSRTIEAERPSSLLLLVNRISSVCVCEGVCPVQAGNAPSSDEALGSNSYIMIHLLLGLTTVAVLSVYTVSVLVPCKVLVTGATGRAGRLVVAELLRQGVSVKTAIRHQTEADGVLLVLLEAAGVPESRLELCRADEVSFLVALLSEPAAVGKTVEALAVSGLSFPSSYNQLQERLWSDATGPEAVLDATCGIIQQLVAGKTLRSAEARATGWG